MPSISELTRLNESNWEGVVENLSPNEIYYVHFDKLPPKENLSTFSKLCEKLDLKVIFSGGESKLDFKTLKSLIKSLSEEERKYILSLL